MQYCAHHACMPDLQPLYYVARVLATSNTDRHFNCKRIDATVFHLSLPLGL